MNRLLIEEDDWVGWWNWFCAEFDYNPYLRAYLRVRGGEEEQYTLYGVLIGSDEIRKKVFEETNGERRAERKALEGK